MRFKLTESLITMEDLFQRFDEMSTEDIVNLIDIPEKDSIDDSSPMFILPDGTIASVKEIAKNLGHHADIHSDFIAMIFDELVYWHKMDGDEIADDVDTEDFDDGQMLDVLTNELNWARLNCGNSWVENRFYCVLPPSMTSAQFRSLEKWLEWGYDNKKGEVLILCAEVGKDHVYSFEDNFPDDILKKIKRYYSSGEFYEKLVRK